METMNLSEYIINDIKPLDRDDKIGDMQLLFNQLTYSHIPIKNKEGDYLGCMSETDAHFFNSTRPRSEYSHAIEGCYVRHNPVWLHVVEAFAQNSTTIMPVLNEKNISLGYYELNDIIGLF